ncbi:cytochrome c biogenesis heme-transporting ATPase CcmA [Legionella septentrionalis]|uniref:Cytochrome c biogenesis heme-transporting ATPase CcmA n=1 Tax=Legionella septentrionalis TaxID=2498109 RepID=A0A3S0V4K2_9GAMM|nr:cytochrome c biogenesis heme-transporting ATPase CcmA [Legionella septentrionalis]RUQ81618.1 cytochrome c biogenesis heme-transporting ATPase CcmA [Legionella septentrionalis]RUQ95737.1 cytochrome c biogenesis heme-transporting ATPase CcmA [Legionella septentrionalis]RUR09149.1 cytochrome c biogenesis heme-transporting ATPase CcmA [Legionella septentrionalis]RUR15657.1 cytochrome c biogenesis heme-transporting ATPase CcmA [Legionella septentrionalis]
MLEVSALDFDYQDKPLLRNIQFALSPGRLLHLRGANGAGKTTLLRLLAGLLSQAHGEIRYQGVSIYDDLPSYQQNICYVGHKPGISLLLTARENYHFGLHDSLKNVSFQKLIARLSLEGCEDTPGGLLSAGQRRRVALMRLFTTKASLWLLDEPLVALDADGIIILMDCIKEHLKRDGQIVLTSHQNLPLPENMYEEYCL